MMFPDVMPWLHSMFGAEIDWKAVLLIGMTPFFLLAFAFEWAYQTRVRGRHQDFYWKDILANLSLGASYQVVEVAVGALLTGVIAFWLYPYRLFDIPLNAWTALPIFIGVELCFYCYHRSAHRVRFFWSAHVAHHASEHMNFTTAMRQSLLNPVVGAWAFMLPPVLLGVHPGVVGFMLAANLAYQYFIHTNLIGKLPFWVEYLFNTPSHHRVHHGKNPQYIDKNYGGTLIIFDRLFGSFEPEVEQPVYGITRQIHSYNYFVLNFHEMVDMTRDMLRPGPLWLRLKHFWAPPDWVRPGDTSPRSAIGTGTRSA